jgi:hypothetical protein
MVTTKSPVPRIAKSRYHNEPGGVGSRIKRDMPSSLGVRGHDIVNESAPRKPRLVRQSQAVRRPDVKAIVDSWLPPVLNRVLFLQSQLSDNWDGRGADRIVGDAAASAVAALLDLVNTDTPTPSIVPTVHGGIQVEWHEQGMDLEIKFDPGEEPYVVFEDFESDEEWFGELSSHFEDTRMALTMLGCRAQLRP